MPDLLVRGWWWSKTMANDLGERGCMVCNKLRRKDTRHKEKRGRRVVMQQEGGAGDANWGGTRTRTRREDASQAGLIIVWWGVSYKNSILKMRSDDASASWLCGWSEMRHETKEGFGLMIVMVMGSQAARLTTRRWEDTSRVWCKWPCENSYGKLKESTESNRKWKVESGM